MEVRKMKEINDSIFKKEVFENNVPVMVDFWAPWCGPCRMVSPVMEELDKQYKGKIKFVKVNVDENPRVSSQFGITSIPTLMLVKDGKTAQRFVGFRPKADFVKVLDKYVK
jgi:thioredoxin 1